MPATDPSVPAAGCWIVLPTYNEAENLSAVVDRILAVLEREDIDGHLLVVDDSSPDGTGALAERLAAVEPRLSVLHRSRKEGLGKAYVAGFREALASGAQFILEMDCDGSHDPEALPHLLDAARNADLVLGSRYVIGGDIKGWTLARRLISRAGCFYARVILRSDIRDLTGGFKCFRRETLLSLDLDDLSAAGYGFQIELTYRAVRLGHRVTEVPIVFHDRIAGASKMSWRIAFEAARLVPALRLRTLPFARGWADRRTDAVDVLSRTAAHTGP